MSEQRSPPSRSAQGPVGWLLSLAGRFIGLVISALVLRVVLELAGLYFWWPQEGSRHVFSGDEAGTVGTSYCVTTTSAGGKNSDAAGERGISRAYNQQTHSKTTHSSGLYTGQFYATPDVAGRHVPPALSVRVNRADRRPSTAGFKAVWLRAGIRFSPPLCHQVRQFSRHNDLGVLSGAAAVSTCEVSFITSHHMVWDNGMDGGW
ncbi:Uncharacterised protein [Klebsiella pneumoniae]|nr:Uncharacterised protein [Klebsiella pneumoniae]